ncbi:hypothetical protein Tco_1009994 [Tanacetum coccineum]
MHVLASLYRRRCVVMIPFLIVPCVSALAGCDKEAKENVVKVDEHLMTEEIEKLVDEANVADDQMVVSDTPRHDDILSNPGTSVEPVSDKESPKAKIIVEVVPFKITDEEEESARDDDFELGRRDKGNEFLPKLTYEELGQRLEEMLMKALPNIADTTKLIEEAILRERKALRSEITSQVTNAIANHLPWQVDSSVGKYMSGHIKDISIWIALKIKFEELGGSNVTCRPSVIRPQDQDDPHDDAHPEGENRAKRQKIFEYGAFETSESSFAYDNESEPELPTENVSQDFMNELSLSVDENRLNRLSDEMLIQHCTSGDEHQYYIDQMQNFLKYRKAGEKYLNYHNYRSPLQLFKAVKEIPKHLQCLLSIKICGA